MVDFLSGKAPLNLTMRLGDHMMLIQLQLSTVNSSSSKRSRTSSQTSSSYKPKLDTRALAEASKNLTQTLKQLSSEVLTTKSAEEVKKHKSDAKKVGRFLLCVRVRARVFVTRYFRCRTTDRNE